MRPEQFAAMCRNLPAAQSADKLEDAKEAIEALFHREQKANFGRMEDESGAAWVPRKGNPPNPFLYLTGDMYSAATRKGALGNISEHGDRQMTLGISKKIPYAAEHQNGDQSRRLPRRQFFYWKKDRRRRARPILYETLRRIYQKVRGSV